MMIQFWVKTMLEPNIDALLDELEMYITYRRTARKIVKKWLNNPPQPTKRRARKVR